MDRLFRLLGWIGFRADLLRTRLSRTAMGRFFGVVGLISVGAVILTVLRLLLGLDATIHSTFLPQSFANVVFYVIYYLWAIVIWKISTFFKKPEVEVEVEVEPEQSAQHMRV